MKFLLPFITRRHYVQA